MNDPVVDFECIQRDKNKRKKVINSSFIHRLQKRHFILFDILPFLGTLVALVLIPYIPFSSFELFLFFVFWLITGFGISSGYHRLFTHRSFKAKKVVEIALAISGAMAGQGGVISWASLHRRHHELSDKQGDPHSPNLHGRGWRNIIRGLVHSHVSWMYKHDYPSVVHYVPDLIKDKTLVKIDRYYYLWAVAGLLLPTILGGIYHRSFEGALSGFIWGGMVRMFWLEHTIWSINSFLHCFGTRRFQTQEQSHNFGLVALLTFGESWHNNHHAFPGSASFGLEWYRLDPASWLIHLLAALGLVSDIKIPSKDKIAAHS